MKYTKFILNSFISAFFICILIGKVHAADKPVQDDVQKLQGQLAVLQKDNAELEKQNELKKQIEEEKKKQEQLKNPQNKSDGPSKGVQARDAIKEAGLSMKDVGQKIGNMFH